MCSSTVYDITLTLPAVVYVFAGKDEGGRCYRILHAPIDSFSGTLSMVSFHLYPIWKHRL